MYGTKFTVSDAVLDVNFLLPIGKAKIQREGTDVTITAFSRGVGMALAAADILAKNGISAEVINLRSLRPLDRDAIINSVKKTSRLLSLEEGWPQCGVGAEIISIVNETEAFDFLDHPPVRLTGADLPMPYAPGLEKQALPTVDNIVTLVQRMMARPFKK